MHLRFFIPALLTAALLCVPVPLPAQDAEGNPPAEFDKYWLVFLERGDDPPQLDDDASAELQRQHLAHLSKVYKEGSAMVAVPF